MTNKSLIPQFYRDIFRFLRGFATLFSLLVFSLPIIAEAVDFPLEPLSRETPLVVEGQALGAIVYPEKDAILKGLAEKIAEKIKNAAGVDCPIISDVQTVSKWCGALDEKFKRMPLIILGDINKNRAVFPLYAKYLCWCDGNYPGEGGYDLRTVVSPYYYRGPNHLVIAAGGEKEYPIAVDAFIRKIESNGKKGNLIIPGFLDVKLGEKWKGEMDEARNVAARKETKIDAQKVFSRALVSMAKLYQLTGERACAEAVRQAFLRELAKDSIEGRKSYIRYYPGNSTEKVIPGSCDYALEALARSWELTRDSGVYMPEEIRSLNQALFLGMDLIKDDYPYWENGPPDNELGDRHNAAGTFAFMVMGQMLRRNCPDDTATARRLDAWISGCKKYFDAFPERRDWHGRLDNNDSVQLTGLVLNYALREGNLAIYESGLAREAAKHAMSLVDSMGYRIGHGAYEDAGYGALTSDLLVGEILSLAGFYYRDPHAKWLTENFPGCKFSTWFAHGSGQEHAFAMDRSVPAKKPEDGDFIGVARSVAQHDNYLLKQKNNETDVAYEKAFEKISLRDGFDATDKFLVLQGMEPSTWPLGDANSILRMTDQGRICLFHNHKWRSRFHRNGVLVSPGFAKTSPRVPRFDFSAGFKGGDFIRTSLPDYNGTTWTRSIFSLKNSITVVFDDVKAERPGDYSAICAWRTPVESRMAGSDWISSSDGVDFHVLSSESLRYDTVVEPKFPGECGITGTGLRQIQYRKLVPGGKLTFRNLLYTNGKLRPANFEIGRLSENAVIVRGKDDACWLIGLDGLKTDAVETDAAMFMIGKDSAFLSEATSLKVKGREIWKASSPGNAEIKNSTALAGIRYADMWGKGSKPDLQPPPIVPEKSFFMPGKEPLRHLWSYKEFQGQLKPVPGISVITEDREKQTKLNVLFNWNQVGVADLGNGQDFVMDLHDRVDIRGMRIWKPSLTMAVQIGSPYGWGPKIWPPVLQPPAELEIAVCDTPEFANLKPITTELVQHYGFREIVKGSASACYFYATDQLKLSGRYLRIRFPKEKNLVSAGIEVLSSQILPPEFMDAVAVKTPAGEAVAVATGAGEITAIATDGKPLFSKIFPGVEPMVIATSDIDGDGADEIVFSGSDGGLHIIGRDNQDRWISPQMPPTGGQLAYSIVPGDWIKTGKRPVYTTSYNTMNKWEEGKGWTTKTAGHMWNYALIPPSNTIGTQGKRFLCLKDINGTIGVVDSEELVESNRLYAITGEGRLMYWSHVDLPDGKGPGLLLVNSSRGLGMYKISPDGKFSVIWDRSDDVRQFCGLLIDVPGKDKRILVGRADGFIAEFDLAGKLIANHWTGWPVKALESSVNSDGESFVFAGTDGGIACFDKAWKAVQFIPGACVKLLKIRSKEKNLVFSFSDRGALNCYSSN